MVFTPEVFLEVAVESWSEWDLNPRPLNSVQMLKSTELSVHYKHKYIYIYTYIHIYIYTHTHTHRYIYIYIYIYNKKRDTDEGKATCRNILNNVFSVLSTLYIHTCMCFIYI